MTAFAEGVKRKLNNLSKGSKSNARLCETVHVRSRIETIASTIKKASDLQQNLAPAEETDGIDVSVFLGQPKILAKTKLAQKVNCEMTNHAQIKLFRKPNIKSMRVPTMAKPLMLFLFIFRKGYIYHPLTVGFFFTKDDLNIVSPNRDSYHSFVPNSFVTEVISVKSGIRSIKSLYQQTESQIIPRFSFFIITFRRCI
ncbi:MAG: hypothetical protein WBV70_07860 [Candidatus Bathyarchaeia archaeon]